MNIWITLLCFGGAWLASIAAVGLSDKMKAAGELQVHKARRKRVTPKQDCRKTEKASPCCSTEEAKKGWLLL